MTAPSTIQRFFSLPAAEESGLRPLHARKGLYQWEPFDGNAVLNDVANALDNVVLAEEDIEQFTQRLPSHLMGMVTIGIAGEAERDAAAAQLIAQVRALSDQDVLGDHQAAVGHLRRMAWTVNELFDRLVAKKCLRAAA
ncbi:DUF6415 family natural product biosynthesis protein [Streptomyces sp. NPDC085946]|uniref:DUF6415 family natural product biosynthesis protein n=1 Tax=Streptomyces sp. NPDC085946 TaxID=3365744 RepID=UPI0037D056E9